MGKKIKYLDFTNEIAVKYRLLSYNSIAPSKPAPRTKIRLRWLDIYRLLQPYFSSRFTEQLRVVGPLAAYLCIFQIFILRLQLRDPWIISGGLLAVILGLMFFIEGLKLGVMPIGQTIGDRLPAKFRLHTVMMVTFVLGVGLTFAEPAIGALQAAGAIIDPKEAPHLYFLLTEWPVQLALVVGAGVGLAAMLGIMRSLFGWSLKPLIGFSVLPALGLTAYFSYDPHLKTLVGLAWDCGAITTGPVTVPVVLSVGIGAAAVAGAEKNPLAGFGIVTLASLFPIVGVLLLGLYAVKTVPAEQIIQAAELAASATASSKLEWFEETPWLEIIGGLRAVIPLIAFLLLVLIIMLGERVRDRLVTSYGLILTVAGMIMFNLGLTYGLAKLGSQAGGVIPAAFVKLDQIPASPLFIYTVGVLVAVLFSWLLGLGATLAEPALNALGETVENLTEGVFRKTTLMMAVAVGVACGITIGVVKLVFAIPLGVIVIPAYVLAFLLTLISTEEYVNLAWDSAGVTTGPVTVPLVLAMGLGFGEALNAVEGFGILAVASVMPIIAVLATGLWIRWKIRASHEQDSPGEQKRPLEATAEIITKTGQAD